MKDKNSVSQVKYEFDITEPLQKVCDEIRANLQSFNACIVARRSDKIYVRVTYCEEYNLLPADIVIQHVITAMSSISDVTVHSQIPLEQFILQYKQMLLSVTNDICRYLNVPFDEYYQEVCLTLTRLRNEGKYIHKALLRKAAFNDCLKAFKKDIKHTQFIDENGEKQTRQVSIFGKPKDDDDATYADILEDEKAIEELDDVVLNDMQRWQLEQIKACCSSREYQQLIRAYQSNTTSNYTNSIIRKIKKGLRGD